MGSGYANWPKTKNKSELAIIRYFKNETVGTHPPSVFVFEPSKNLDFRSWGKAIFLRLEEELQNADSLLDAMPCIGGFGEEKSD